MKMNVSIVRGALLAAETYLLEQQQASHGYGYFPGGDPRSFDPDPECSTEEERAAHKAACEAWERGERPEGPRHVFCSPEEAAEKLAAGGFDAATIGHEGARLQPSGFGLGTYHMHDEEADDVLAQIRAALAQLGDAEMVRVKQRGGERG